jgi:hypothetical protein
LPQIVEESPAAERDGEVNSEGLARQQAVRQIERRRRFHVQFVSSAVGMGLLVIIWAVSEYHNAGGWPTNGLSQSSGIHDVWNFWIVYPLVAWALIISARAWSVYGHRPIPESEIRDEIERQQGRPTARP